MYTTYYTIKKEDGYTVDESFEYEDIMIYTYLDPNDVHVLIGIGVRDPDIKCKWMSSDEYTVVHIGESGSYHSVDELPCSNQIQLYRDINGKVTTIIAHDGQHRIREMFLR